MNDSLNGSSWFGLCVYVCVCIKFFMCVFGFLLSIFCAYFCFLYQNKTFSFQDSSMENYYLKINGQSVFIATFNTDNPSTIVHNKPLKKGHGKFLPNTIFARCVLNWDSFDAHIHCPG